MAPLNLRRLGYVILISFALIGCEKKTDYQYLMTHPMVLQKQMTFCKTNSPKTLQEMAHCRVVTYAAVNFTSLLMTQQQDPQKFGQQIMDAQYASIQASAKLAAVQASFDMANTKNNGMNLEKAKQDYQNKLAEVDVLLAVLSLGRPE